MVSKERTLAIVRASCRYNDGLAIVRASCRYNDGLAIVRASFRYNDGLWQSCVPVVGTMMDFGNRACQLYVQLWTSKNYFYFFY